METKLPTETRYKTSDDIVVRAIGGEYILIPILSKASQVDCIYNLNPVGARIWDLLDGVNSLRDIHQAIITEYNVSGAVALADIEELVKQLLYINAIEEN